MAPLGVMAAVAAVARHNKVLNRATQKRDVVKKRFKVRFIVISKVFRLAAERCFGAPTVQG